MMALTEPSWASSDTSAACPRGIWSTWYSIAYSPGLTGTRFTRTRSPRSNSLAGVRPVHLLALAASETWLASASTMSAPPSLRTAATIAGSSPF